MKHLNAQITLKDAFTGTLSKIINQQDYFINKTKGVSGELNKAYKLDADDVTNAISSISKEIDKNREKLKDAQSSMSKWKELLNNSTPVVKSLSAEVQDLSLKKQKLIKEMDKLKSSSDTAQLSKYNSALDDINKTLKEKTSALNKAKTENNKYAKGLKESQREVSQLDVSIGSLTKKLEELSNKSKKSFSLKSISDKLNDKYDKSEKEKDKYSGFNKLGDNIKGAGKGLTAGFTAPLSIGIGASLKVGMDFESQMSSVEATLGDKASIKNMELLEEKAREMGATTSKSATESAQAMEYMALAGWDTTQIIGGIEPILRLSEASKADLATTSDLVTDSMSALGLQVNDLNGFLDKVSKTSTSANTSSLQLMESFIITGGKVKSLGGDLSETSAILGTMANRGLKGAEAGRGLSAIITNLTSPSGQAKEALDALNFSAFDSAGSFIGLEATFKKLQSSLQGMTQEQKVTYMSMIAGKEHGKTLDAILEGLSNEYTDLKNSIVNSDGSLKKMAETMQNNTAGSITSLKSKLESVGISVSKVLLPHINSGIDVVGKLVDKFSSLSPETQSSIVKFGLFAAIMPPLIIGGGALVSSIGSIARGFKLVGTTIGKLPALVGGLSNAIKGLHTTFTLLAVNPITLVVGGLVLIGVTLVGLYNAHEGFRKKIDSIWQSILEKAENAVNGVIGCYNKIIGIINKIPGVDIKLAQEVTWSDKSKQQKLDNGNQSGNVLKVSKDNPLSSPGYNTSLIAGSYKTGLSYVPYDGFIAELHQGERVLTAEENKLYNTLNVRDRSQPNNSIIKMINGNSSNNSTVNNWSSNNNSNSNITINVPVTINAGSNSGGIDVNNIANTVANIIAKKIRGAKINVV